MEDQATFGAGGPGSPKAPGQVPDHTLIRQIARGSYGEVWLAQSTLGQFRAIKFIRRSTFATSEPFSRELAGITKFEPVSRGHEGLMDVLHVGHDDGKGYFYYVMELADDQGPSREFNPATYLPKTLASELKEKKVIPLEDCIRFSLCITRALQYLHGRGLVHRDLKPSNIIFVDGAPKLADIGLVADVAAAQSYVGTEGYIPPEGPGKATADIFGLGRVIYEMSTGKDRCEFPQLPAGIAEADDRTQFLELNEIVVKACENKAADRYQTAAEILADLGLLENGKSLRRLRVLESRVRRVRRIAYVGAIPLALVLFLCFAVNRERRLQAEALQRVIGSHLAEGDAALRKGDLLGSFGFYVKALGLDRRPNEDTLRLRIGAILHQTPKLTQLWQHTGAVCDVRFNALGDQIVVAESNGMARVWDVLSGLPIAREFGPGGVPFTTAFSPDGQRVVTALQNHVVQIWDVATGKSLVSLPKQGHMTDASFSPDGSFLVTASVEGEAHLFETRTWQELPVILRHSAMINHARFSHDSQMIVTASRDQTAQVWSLSGRPIGPPIRHPSWVLDASFSPDDQLIVTANFDRKARVFDYHSGSQVLPLMSHQDGISSAEYTADGQYIVTAAWDSTVRLWDARTAEPLKENHVLRHKSRVLASAVSPDGRRVAAACRDGSVWLWDLAGSAVDQLDIPGKIGPDIHMAPPQSAFAARVAVNPKPSSDDIQPEELLLSVMAVQAILTNSDFVVGIELSIPRESRSTLRGQLSADRKWLLVYLARTFQLFDSTGKPVKSAITGKRSVLSAKFTAAGDKVLLVHRDGVAVHATKTCERLYDPISYVGDLKYLDFSPDQQLAVLACSASQFEPGFAQVWDVATGHKVGPALFHEDGVICASFSQDGRWLATGGEDFNALIWDFRNGRLRIPPIEHEDQVSFLHFSADGRWLATACRDGAARIWETATGQPVTPAFRHLHPVRVAKFLNDTELLTSERDVHDWIWPLVIDHHSMPELDFMAELFSGRSSSKLTKEHMAIEKLGSFWKEGKRDHPEDYNVSPNEAIIWHRRQLDRCESKEEWLGAALHCDYLRALDPSSAPIYMSRKESALAKRKHKEL